jgi:hypothetical protein
MVTLLGNAAHVNNESQVHYARLVRLVHAEVATSFAVKHEDQSRMY